MTLAIKPQPAYLLGSFLRTVFLALFLVSEMHASGLLTEEEQVAKLHVLFFQVNPGNETETIVHQPLCSGFLINRQTILTTYECIRKINEKLGEKEQTKVKLFIPEEPWGLAYLENNSSHIDIRDTHTNRIILIKLQCSASPEHFPQPEINYNRTVEGECEYDKEKYLNSTVNSIDTNSNLAEVSFTSHLVKSAEPLVDHLLFGTPFFSDNGQLKLAYFIDMPNLDNTTIALKAKIPENYYQYFNQSTNATTCIVSPNDITDTTELTNEAIKTTECKANGDDNQGIIIATLATTLFISIPIFFTAGCLLQKYQAWSHLQSGLLTIYTLILLKNRPKADENLLR